LDDIAGGAHSLPEVEFVRLVRQAGLPAPTCQRVLQRSNGRYYLDADWDDYGVSAEVDGVQHEDFRSRDRDRERRNNVTAQGRRVLNFVSYEIRHLPRDVVQVLARALQAGGWMGEPTYDE
jgi:very-short-patch-repair endonuclease